MRESSIKVRPGVSYGVRIPLTYAIFTVVGFSILAAGLYALANLRGIVLARDEAPPV